MFTAIHEAGHVVAHIRLGVQSGEVSIIPKGETMGHVFGEGIDHVYCREAAELQALAYLAGWAAVLAETGCAQTAAEGADDDYEHVDELISLWELEPLAIHQDRALALMREPQNLRAVKMLAEKLEALTRIDPYHAAVIVEMADGLSTQADYERWVREENRRLAVAHPARQHP